MATKAPAKKKTAAKSGAKTGTGSGKKRRTSSKLTLKSVTRTLKGEILPALIGTAGGLVAGAYAGGRTGVAGVATRAAVGAAVPVASHMVAKKKVNATTAAKAVGYATLAAATYPAVRSTLDAASPAVANGLRKLDDLVRKIPGAKPPTAGVAGVGRARNPLPRNWPSTERAAAQAETAPAAAAPERRVRIRGVGQVVKFGPGARGASRFGVAQF